MFSAAIKIPNDLLMDTLKMKVYVLYAERAEKRIASAREAMEAI